jgi:hypothetical protein
MDSVGQILMRKIAAKLKQSPAPMVEPADSDNQPPDDDDMTALVCAALKPRPYTGAGAIALPEPDDHYPLI